MSAKQRFVYRLIVKLPPEADAERRAKLASLGIRLANRVFKEFPDAEIEVEADFENGGEVEDA